MNRTLVADFVIYAHSDLDMTQKLLAREPGLIHSAMDWGNGDFETALGGASHMGRRDIVSYLLAQGARPDLFCAAMLGQLPVIESLLDFQPALIDAKGPHGFSLHFHAQVGGKSSKPVLDYLQSIKEVQLRPVPFLKDK
ncbi:MAG: ankyrin repeat domain-containing protein [Planctomycetota bacterium]